MVQSSPRVTMLTIICLLCISGQELFVSGSASAEDRDPVAVDLVPLALAIPEAVADIEEANEKLPFLARQHQKGFVTQTEVDALRKQQTTAIHKLRMLQVIVDAEHKASVERVDLLKNANRLATGSVPEAEVNIAVYRSEVLAILKEACTVDDGKDKNAAADEDTTQLDAPQDTFSGVVRVVGELPELSAISTTRMVKSLRQSARGKAGRTAPSPCGEDTIPDESLLVGPDGGLANVFVYLKEAPDGIYTPIVEEAAHITAQNCRFEPRCSIVQVGQSIRCNNLDNAATNFRFTPLMNSPRNQVVAASDQDGFTLVHTRVEPFPFFIRSDVLPWMSACQLVVNHPFAALTDEEGRFRISGLPKGEYVFRVWHERAGYINKSLVITIGENEQTDVEITVDAERLLKNDSST